MKRSAALAAVVLALVAAAWGQNLEELAKKEKARRKRVPDTKTFTNEDITKPSPSPSPNTDPNLIPNPDGAEIPGGKPARRPYRPPATPRPEGETSRESTEGRANEGASANEGAGEAPSTDDAGAQAYWRGRAQALHETIEKTQGSITALEARAAQLRLDRDPNPPDQFDPNRLQKREAEAQKALEDADKARVALTAAQQQLQALADEARGKGVPLAWVQ